MASGNAVRLARAVSISLSVGAVLAGLPALAAPGDPLGPAFLVGPTSGIGRPVVARSASGEFVVVWHNPGASDSGVTAQRFHADGSTDGGAIAVVASGTTVPDLSVAMDGAGDFVVAWTAFNSVATAWAQRFPAAGAAGVAFQLDGASSGVRSSASPSVAMNADGSFVVAWLRSVDSGALQYNLPPIPDCPNGAVGLELNDPAIAFRRYNAAGAAQGQGPGITEAKPGIGFSAYVCLAELEIYAGTSSLGPNGGSTLSAPVTAIGPGGGFSIAWAETEYDGVSLDFLPPALLAPTHVSIQPYSAGGLPLGVQQVVALTPGLVAGNAAVQAPRVAQGTAGGILIWDAYSYQSSTQSNQYAVKLRSFDNIGLPLQLFADTVASGEQVFPWGDYLADVAATPDGSVVAWRSTSSSGATETQQINLQRLGSSGALLGAPIVAASAVPSSPSLSYTQTLTLTAPAIASDGSGNFAVFWTTLNYDASQVLTYGRLYSGG